MRVGKNSEGTTESHSQSCNLNLILNCDGLTTWTGREGARIRVRKIERKRAKMCVQQTVEAARAEAELTLRKSGLKHKREKPRGQKRKRAKLIKTFS